MIRRKLKQLGSIVALSSTLLFTNSTAGTQDFIAGVAAGAMAGTALGAYNSPRYYDDRPYYYYNNRYYYGGDYRDGYYIYQGQRFRSGHYYNDGYRYHKGHRYSPRVGNYGYYRSDKEYKSHHRRKPHYDQRQQEYRRDRKQDQRQQEYRRDRNQDQRQQEYRRDRNQDQHNNNHKQNH